MPLSKSELIPTLYQNQIFNIKEEKSFYYNSPNDKKLLDELNQNSEFSVVSLGNNQFDVNLNSPYVGKIELTVYNVLGLRMVFHRFENTGTFNYALDMSYVAKGIYLVKVGNSSFGKVQKIIVE